MILQDFYSIEEECKQAAMKTESSRNQELLLSCSQEAANSYKAGQVAGKEQTWLAERQERWSSVWHNGLLAKLGQIGVEETFLDTIRSYLAGRKQCVIVEGEKSEILEVWSGAPQGSRLGPLLFIIYMNDIVSIIESDILISFI